MPLRNPLPSTATPPSLHAPQSTSHLKLMVLGKTIPFIVETQRYLAFGACPASLW